MKRIMRYLQGTFNFGLLYNRCGSKKFVGFSDADWAGDLDDRKSTSGHLFQISGGAVTWRSKKQTCVALSTAEAEYMALASSVQEAIWMRQLTDELGNGPTEATTIFEDNQSAICDTKNPQFHGRAKHIGIKYHFIREQVSSGTVKLEYCPTKEMIADMLTKGLHRDQFTKLRDMAGVKEIPEQFACRVLEMSTIGELSLNLLSDLIHVCCYHYVYSTCISGFVIMQSACLSCNLICL